MIEGHKQFVEHFRKFEDCYIAIGGLATHAVLDEAALEFRVTKDFDLILVVEALRPEFFNVFWSFIRKGGYEVKQATDNPRQHYRFRNPTTDEFPSQIELFSKRPDVIALSDDMRFTPIPAEEDGNSLSAILMDEEYYEFVKANTTMYHGLRVATHPALICLKAKAFLDLHKRKEAEEGRVDSHDIAKHKNDIFRLAATLTGTEEVILPDSMKTDLKAFVEIMVQNPPQVKDMLKSMGISTSLDSTMILTAIKRIFKLT